MIFDLTGKTALVTGATGGIGGAIAAALKGQGATVIGSGSTLAKAEAARERLGLDCALAADLSDRAAVDALAAAADARGVDVLVNCAGVTRDGLAMRMKDVDFDAVIEVNLTAAFRLSRALLRGMIKRRVGRIVSIGSVVGASGNAGQANYAAAKAGLVGLTKALAREVAARGVTVNARRARLHRHGDDRRAGRTTRSGAIAGAHPRRHGWGRRRTWPRRCVYLASAGGGLRDRAPSMHVNGGMAMI